MRWPRPLALSTRTHTMNRDLIAPFLTGTAVPDGSGYYFSFNCRTHC